MIDPVGIAGIVIGLGIALWQNRKAVRAEADLNSAMDAVPGRVADALKTIISAGNTPEVKAAQPEGWPGGVEYVDVDGDGKKELAVQYPAGAHGSQLKVFKWSHHGDFAEIGHLGVGTPVGFDFGDFDGDGKPEIRTEETDWSAGLPYVTAPRMTLLYRWNGSDFVEVSRRKNPEPETA